MPFDPLQEAREIVGETEFYAFDMGAGVVERYTTNRRDVASAFGFSWKALPIHREGVDTDQGADGAKTKLVLPCKNTRFIDIVTQTGLDTITVTIIRGFGKDYVNDYRNPWFTGFLTDINVGVNVVEGNLRSVEGLFDAAIPRILYQPGCNNLHYGPVCALQAALFQETHTLLSVAAKSRLVTTSGGVLTNDHYTFGFMKRTDDDLWRSIIQQAGNQFVLHVPIHGIFPGMQVHVLPGCDLLVQTCITKYGNKHHFVGMPLMPSSNPVIDGF